MLVCAARPDTGKEIFIVFILFLISPLLNLESQQASADQPEFIEPLKMRIKFDQSPDWSLILRKSSCSLQH